MRWYYVVNGEVVGPVRTHYLSRILKQGLINNKTYVYNKEVLKDWTRIKYVSELLKDLTKDKEKETERKRTRQRKRTRKYYREKAKRKHVVEVEETEEEVEDQSESSSSEQDMTMEADSLDHMGLKNGDWVETMAGKTGRILYIGSVQGIPGEVIGLELSKTEGDCDGSYQGHRYFQCKKKHGQFLTRGFIKKVVMDPSYTKKSPYQAVIDDLNLNLDFDAVSLGLASTALGFTFNDEDVANAWETLHSSSQKCDTAADQLEILLNMLEEPISSKQSTEFTQIQTRWRTFSEANEIH